MKIHQKDNVTIFCGDCIEEIKQIKPHSIDVILVDPPFNVGTVYDEYEDDLSEEEYLKWMKKLLTSCYNRLVKNTGSMVVFWEADRILSGLNTEIFKPQRQSAVIWSTVDTSSPEYDHPDVMSLVMAKAILESMGVKEGSKVLDPTCGTGTTLVAAKQLGAEVIGIELSRLFCNTAIERSEAA